MKIHPVDLTLPHAPDSIGSTSASDLDEIHRWIHDREYDPRDVRHLANERVLEVPFFCTVYDDRRLHRGWFVAASWWVPVVRGYLRFHNVRQYTIRDDGFGMMNEIEVAATGREFSINGISEVSGVVDEFKVSLEIGDRIIGWVPMRRLLLAEWQGRLQAYDESADDLKSNHRTKGTDEG